MPLSLLLATLLFSATPRLETLSPGAPPPAATVVTPGTAVGVPSTAGLATPGARPGLAQASGHGGTLAWFLPSGVLVALAGLAFVAARRKQRRPRWIQVLESSSLGGKRSLVVAKVGTDTLVLGVSEAGIALLGTARLPAPTSLEDPEAVDASATPASRSPAPGGAPESGPAAEPSRTSVVLRAVRAFRPPPPVSPFDQLLHESVEDEELRRKLARGLAGSIQ